ncbi:hypothetical protein SK224_05450 [Microbacterium sp. BG28]|uniref:hypothetical protein n=1 Tax=Microbacterium sp. BG28 TaxID=3097356 RepID=UPI002A59E7B6|nr:hypothetical protein [Microbacterium sp. BG28]MDY0828570.1 hypothetical protein [Microbacterium sp. BG28]
MSVLDEVAAERARQSAKWGVQRHPDGTGPDSMPLYAETATGIADNDEAAYIRDVMQGRTEWRFHDTSTRDQPGTWTDILLEEVFEALAESDPEKLRTELIQVAAVATQWVEAIDDRPAA